MAWVCWRASQPTLSIDAPTSGCEREISYNPLTHLSHPCTLEVSHLLRLLRVQRYDNKSYWYWWVTEHEPSRTQ